jgi:hypothetical protein
MPQDKPMNEQNESPAGPADEPAAIRLPERLQQIERRLKRARPRPPEFDATALEQLARTALADPRGVEPAAVVAARPRGERRRGRARSLATIAAVWACGALVGSLATMLLMSRIRANDDPIRPVAQNEERLPPPAAGPEPAPAEAPPIERRSPSSPGGATASNSDAVLLAALADPSGGDLLWRRIERTTLRAGAHFRKDLRGASEPLSPTTTAAKQSPPAAGPPQTKAWPDSEPTPSVRPDVTRERMLDGMLREMSGAVL